MAELVLIIIKQILIFLFSTTHIILLLITFSCNRYIILVPQAITRDTRPSAAGNSPEREAECRSNRSERENEDKAPQAIAKFVREIEQKW